MAIAARGEFHERVRVLHGDGQRLLDEHVLSSLERRSRQRRMIVRRCQDQNQIDVRREAIPEMDRLRDEMQLLVNLAVLDPDQGDIIHIAHSAPQGWPPRATTPGRRAVAHCTALGKLLLASGKITEGQLRSALTRQSSELLYDVIRWPRGRFEFRREIVDATSEPWLLSVPVASVVLEGFRRVDEWRVLERTLGSFDAVLVRDELALATIDRDGLPAKEFDALFGTDAPVIFAFHGYPSLIHRLAYRRTCHSHLHVRGYKERGTTTTPFDMVVLNDLDRYHLVLDVIHRAGLTDERAVALRSRLQEKRAEHRRYVREHGVDLPEVRDWQWRRGGR